MNINIAHLYYDILNLYGDWANLAVLKRYLHEQGAQVNIDKISFGDEADFSKYDFIYLASGTEQKLISALDDIKRFSSEILEAYKTGTLFFATGNSYEIFGEKIIDGAKNEHQALSFFDFETVNTFEKRTLCDQVCSCEFLEKPLVGFINKASENIGIKNPMFTVKYGEGNRKDDKGEGIYEKNFFATHLTGPCLAKNPHLAEFFVKTLIEKAGGEYREVYHELEEKAYYVTLEALLERFSK